MIRNSCIVIFGWIITSFFSSCRNSDDNGNIIKNSLPAIALKKGPDQAEKKLVMESGAIIRGDKTKKCIALVFTGDEFGDGGEFILKTLNDQNILASFFLTGNFYRNREFIPVIKKLKKNGNYLGPHSDKHLLYCDWTKRDSLLITRSGFMDDLKNSFIELKKFGIRCDESTYFLPPYEWYNDSIAKWVNLAGLRLVSYTPGTRSNADYTFPGMGNNYVDSKTIFKSILEYERDSPEGLNGFILLAHIGTDPGRTDKFYYYLPELITELKERGYEFARIDELLD